MVRTPAVLITCAPDVMRVNGTVLYGAASVLKLNGTSTDRTFA